MFTPRERVQWADLLERLQDAQSSSSHRKRLVVEGCEFLEAAPKIDRLLTWGILNPFGPTVESLCLATDPSDTWEVLFGKMSNPFQSWTRAYATVPQDTTAPALVPTLRALFSATQPAVETKIFPCKPTFVFPGKTNRLSHQDIADLVHIGLEAADQLDFRKAVSGMKRFWLKPWDRLNDELRASETLSKPAYPEVTFRDWWPLLSDFDHICAELRAIMEAWEGSIEYQKSPLTESATHVAEGLAFHMRLIEQSSTESS